MISWLQAQVGDTWQQRWVASGAEEVPGWRDLVTGWAAGPPGVPAGEARRPPHLSPGLLVLICGDVIRPGLAWLAKFTPARRGLAEELARTRDAAAFARLATMCHDNGLATQTGQTALTRVGLVMAAKGRTVAEITVGDCLQLVEVTDQVGAKLHGGVHNPLFYQLLRGLGGFGDEAPAALRVFTGHGQPTCAQLIDRYHIACRPVRDVLVDYLTERKLVNDFSSLQRLAYLLGKLFWADLEAHHPGIDTFKLPRDVATGWKQRVMIRTRTARTGGGQTVTTTSARLDGRSVLTAVRAFYLTRHELPPRRLNPPTTTWPSSSAWSSSPPDFAVMPPSRPPCKKSGPSSPPGPPPEHDQQNWGTRVDRQGSSIGRWPTPSRSVMLVRAFGPVQWGPWLQTTLRHLRGG